MVLFAASPFCSRTSAALPERGSKQLWHPFSAQCGLPCAIYVLSGREVPRRRISCCRRTNAPELGAWATTEPEIPSLETQFLAILQFGESRDWCNCLTTLANRAFPAVPINIDYYDELGVRL